MAKVKKMALGGVGSALGGINKAVSSVGSALTGGARPMPGGMVGGNGPAPADALRPMPGRMPAPQGMMGGNAPTSQMQFMSDKMRGGPAPIAPKMGAMGAQAMPLAANNLRTPVMGSGQIAKGAPRTMGAMMKKGGKVSSASSRADGIAVKGKTKGRIV